MPSGNDDLSIRGVLTGSFGVAGEASDEVLYRASTLLRMFRENAVLLADPESISGVMQRGSRTFNEHQQKLSKAARKEAVDTSDIAFWIGTLNDHIDWLDNEIRKDEEKFEARDGDAWREKLALRILDKDDVPQRRTDESMTEYRERVEDALIDEMLEDGEIKDEYLNDPELRDYARWARKEYNRDRAQETVSELSDPNTTPERQQQLIDEMKARGSMQEMLNAARNTAEGSAPHVSIKQADDASRDAFADADRSAASTSFLDMS